MTKTLRLRISGPVPLHGKKPGDEFEVAVDDDGVALELLWRKRLAEERAFSLGYVSIVSGVVPVTPAHAEPHQEG